MTKDSIRIEYTPSDLPKRFADYPKRFESEMRRTLDRILEEMHDSIPPYPTPSRKKMKFTSEKQRRYVMWLISQGKVPYKRRLSAGLGGSFTRGHPQGIWYQKKLGVANYEAAVGTKKEYAEYVIGERQAEYHRGTWWQVKDWKKRAQSGIERIFATLPDRLAQFLEGKGV